MKIFHLTCSTGCVLRLCVPARDAPLPEVESIDELRTMPDAPRLRFEIISDDDDEDGVTNEELREAIVYLEANELIPEGLGAAMGRALLA
jgi:hypothetical protein